MGLVRNPTRPTIIKAMTSRDFLPTNQKEMKQKGWSELDIILITGDAYIDHPSFGAALIGRYLEANGFKVGIIAQPNWRTDTDFQVLGKPRLFFGITSGNLDAMIANYTAEKKPRKTDAYSESGQTGKRPDRALIVYSNAVKKLFPKVPIIIGGLEASLRRLAHYDYWSNSIRRSILLDCRADLLVYGMGELAILTAAQRLANNENLNNIPNTGLILNTAPENALILPSFEAMGEDKKTCMDATVLYLKEWAKKNPKIICQATQKRFVTLYPPKHLTSHELDQLYTTLPFLRRPHPQYQKPIPADGFVKDSVVAHRGCYGGCSFCSLGFHQGKHIISRSKESILSEIRTIIATDPQFRGTIQDIGGPTANMYQSHCQNPHECARLSCLFPNLCPHLKHNQNAHLELLQQAKKISKVKHVFVNSGIRHDLALQNPQYLSGLIMDHISGQLSTAPEHTCDNVLRLMHKPAFNVFEEFQKKFNSVSERHQKKQYIIPYFMASFPGARLIDAYKVSQWLQKHHLKIEQVQNFIPIPMTLASMMYYTELDAQKNPIYVAKGESRYWQRALLQPHLPQNHAYITRAMAALGVKKN